MNTLDLFNQKNMKAEAPNAQIGDTVEVITMTGRRCAGG